MSALDVQPIDRAQQLLLLVRAVVNGEIVRLELALRLARNDCFPSGVYTGSPPSTSSSTWRLKTCGTARRSTLNGLVNPA